MAKRCFVDTNVFIRYFTQDDDGHAEAAEALFIRAANDKVQLIINDLLIAEVAWVLNAVYKLSREQVRIYLFNLSSELKS